MEDQTLVAKPKSEREEITIVDRKNTAPDPLAARSTTSTAPTATTAKTATAVGLAMQCYRRSVDGISFETDSMD